MVRIVSATLLLVLAASIVRAAQPAAVADVCAEIMSQYGIAPDGCDPETDARRESVEVREPATGADGRAVPAYYTNPALEGIELDSNIFFSGGGSALDARARARLDLLAEVLELPRVSGVCLKLVGHSDASGPASANEKISLKRAQVVADYLRQRLARPDRIEEIVAAGESDPLPRIDAEDPWNRRVTIWARPCPKP